MMRKTAHVDHEIVVAERRAALGENDLLVAGRSDLFGGMNEIGRRDELTFLDIDGAAGLARFDEQIGLAAQEGRDLKNVDGFGGDGGLCRLVNIGEDGNAELAHFGKNAQPLGEARSTVRVDAAAVGFIERGFEDVSANACADSLRHVQHVLFRFR